jgi:hypothetical protein
MKTVTSKEHWTIFHTFWRVLRAWPLKPLLSLALKLLPLTSVQAWLISITLDLVLYKCCSLKTVLWYVILTCHRFSVSLLYYGIMFQLPDLSGERHLNFLLGAVVEAISYVLAYFILSRYGRRLPLASFLLISGIICIVLGAVSVVPRKGTYWIGKEIFVIDIQVICTYNFYTLFKKPEYPNSVLPYLCHYILLIETAYIC